MIIRALLLFLSMTLTATSTHSAEPTSLPASKDGPFNLAPLLRDQMKVFGGIGIPTKTGSCVASPAHLRDVCNMTITVEFSPTDPTVCIATVDGALPVPKESKPRIVWKLKVPSGYESMFEFEEQYGILILSKDGGNKQIDFTKSHGQGDGSIVDKKTFHLHNKNAVKSTITYLPIVLYTGGLAAVLCQAVDPIIQNDGG